MKKLNNKGFGFLGVLLVIIVLAAAGGVGVYVYHKNHKAKTSSNTSSSGAAGNATTPGSSKTTLVKIPELGIQLTVPSSLKDFSYVAANVDYSDPGNNDLGTYPTAYMGTKQLESQGCNATGKIGNAPPLGFLTKTTGQYPTNPTSDNTTGTLVKQFSTFYISYRSSMACSQNATTNQIQTTDVEALKQALTSIQLVQ